MAKVFLHDRSDNTVGTVHANARLTVNCPSDSVVTATLGELSNSTVSVDGVATFTGLTDGVWTVTTTKGYQSTTRYVDIVTDYNTTVTIFSAALRIEYPEGSYCTVTNNSEVYPAPDRSGSWVYDVSRPGTFVITCTDGMQTVTRTIEIGNDGGTVDVIVAFFKALINVTYPPGAICTVSKGSTSISASDTTGYWTFEIPSTGEWTVHVTDGIQTRFAVVNIVRDLQTEDAEFEFFEATVDITYPEGSRCTCTSLDGSLSLMAPDTSGRWTAKLPWIGEWLINATDGTSNVTENIEIFEDGQIMSVACRFFEAHISTTYPSDSFKVLLYHVGDYGEKTEVGTDTSGSGNCVFTVRQVGNYEICVFRVSPYVGIESEPSDYATKSVTINADGDNIAVEIVFNTIPEFEYSGEYEIIDDDGNAITTSAKNWNILFKTNGTFKVTDLRGANSINITVCCVGGGGKGGSSHTETVNGYKYITGGGGGGGGDCVTATSIKITKDYECEIEVGAAGGSTSAFGVTAAPGSKGGTADASSGGAGGAGGGTNGAKGGAGGMTASTPGKGSNGTYVLSNLTGKRYGAGGAGGYGKNGETGNKGSSVSGGKHGGGASGTKATAYSGGGGGGQCYNKSAGAGACGIVMIRNKR